MLSTLHRMHHRGSKKKGLAKILLPVSESPNLVG
ncbi:Protein of unknown function [Pyronema omphalodes CBS 100304]|uniref:Uncharacterized protein n=1 Tax=Pyronema omphalodes (strain CBS 100304) TaxID=1076935 RepID=U4LL16_PYROM|nr:Protein of unknown function [Pyronema omphalodes CBS 100304]